MRFMTLVRSPEKSPAGPPPKELFDAVIKLGEEMSKAGVMIEWGGLMSTATGAILRLEGGKLRVIDGPFSEAKEVIGGYSIYSVKSKEEAIQWATRFMNLHKQLWPGWDGETELRQMVDFGPTK